MFVVYGKKNWMDDLKVIVFWVLKKIVINGV